MNRPLLTPLLNRIAEALGRLAPEPPESADLGRGEAFIWHADGAWIERIDEVSRIELPLLQGIDRVRDILLENTRRFARGLPANNALLWGARGMGKSSLVKAVHAEVNKECGGALALVEIHREDIPTPPASAEASRREPAPVHPVLRRPLLRWQ